MTTDGFRALLAHTADPAWLQRHGYFVAEGRYVGRRLLRRPDFDVEAVVLAPAAEAAMAEAINSRPEAARPQVHRLSQAEMDEITGFRLHQGCVAFARRRPLPVWTPAITAAGISVLLERVRDPDNVGSIIRSAAALGARAILMGPDCADPFYRKAVRTSMGAVFDVPLVMADPWPAVLAQVRVLGAALVATTPDPTSEPIDVVAARVSDRPVVLLVGSEGEGLTPAALAAANHQARIPMAGTIDSLNVAVATAVAVYALTRGRGDA